MSSAQLADRFHAILADLFADTPYVEQLGFEVDGRHVLIRAVFDEGDDYMGRLGEVVRRMGRFEEMMWDGIMPDIELRMQAVPTRIGWPGGIDGLRAVIDRRAAHDLQPPGRASWAVRQGHKEAGRRPAASSAQLADRFHAILADLFADTPYVEQLGFEVDGDDVVIRAVFDEGDDYMGRLGEVVRRMGRFEEMMWDGIMPDIELRMQAVPTRIGWPGGIEGLRAVIDRQADGACSPVSGGRPPPQEMTGRSDLRPPAKAILGNTSQL